MAKSSSVVLYDPHTTDREVIAAARFLARYSGRTLEPYTLDLRSSESSWREHGIGLFDVRRAEIERYARQLEGSAEPEQRSDGVCLRSPASTGTPPRKGSSRSRRRRTSAGPDSTTSPTLSAFDRNELGAFLVGVELSSARDQRWHGLRRRNGLRISEAFGANIEDLGVERRPPDAGRPPEGRQGRHHPARTAKR